MAYSKRSGLCDDLATTQARLDDTQATSQMVECGSVASDHPPRLWRVRDRLAEDDVRRLITRYHEGATGRELAHEFKIGLTNVKRLLREHRARQRDRRHDTT